jgi:diguanylate cyclase (GGDEF)-like protein
MSSPSLHASVDRRQQRWQSGALLIAASIIVAIALCALGVGVLSDMHHAKLDRARLAGSNIVSTIASDIARNIEIYDLSLQAVVEGLPNPEVGKLNKEMRQMVLFDRAATAKHLGSIRVLDESGWVTLDSRVVDPPPTNLASRDYFIAHSDNPNAGLFIGAPFITPEGHYAIGISRRLSHSDGTFAGVVVGTLWLSYFNDLFRQVTLDPGSVLALVRFDGTMVMRAPFEAGYIGRNVAGSPVFKNSLELDAGNFQAAGSIDGTQRFYAYQHVANYPLVLTAGRSTDEIYSEWRREALYISAVILLLALATVGLAILSAFELRRRAEAERSLAILATTDSLTGLGNRRHFDESLDREWDRARRQGTPVSLLMIDFDNFKAYNDLFGHQAGDKALVDIANCIAATTREATDIAARYGGEEIAVLLAGTSLRDGYEAAERIRRAIEIIRHANDDNAALPTISAGLACRTPGDGDRPCDLIAAADAALYVAKGNGRDRTALEPGTQLVDAPIRMVA